MPTPVREGKGEAPEEETVRSIREERHGRTQDNLSSTPGSAQHMQSRCRMRAVAEHVSAAALAGDDGVVVPPVDAHDNAHVGAPDIERIVVALVDYERGPISNTGSH